MKRNLFALALAIVMVLGMLPATAQAAEAEPVLHGHFLISEYIDYRTITEGANSWYFYDAAGRVVREEQLDMYLPESRVVEYDYYPDGTRKTARGYENGELQWTTSYDSHGNALKKVDAAGKPLVKYEVVYHKEGRLLKYAEAEGDAVAARFDRYEYTYGKDGSWTEVHAVGDMGSAVPNGEYIQFRDTFDYNAQGRLVRELQDIDYGEAMLRLRIYSYDDQGELSGQYVYCRGYGDNEGTIMDTTYTRIRDSKGRTTQMTAKTLTYSPYDPMQAETNETKTCYAYDGEGRLVRQEEFLGGSFRREPDNVSTWEYDSWGNLVLHTKNGGIVEENVYVPLKEAIWKP